MSMVEFKLNSLYRCGPQPNVRVVGACLFSETHDLHESFASVT